MKVLLTWLLLLSLLTDPGKISKVNTLKKEAQKAYNAGDYSTAIEKYRMLKDSMKIAEDEVTLNLANAYFQQNDTTAALTEYQQILGSSNNAIRSTSNQQIGILNNRQGKFEEALNNFKQAIKADPNNMDARYNYEMLKKKLEEKKKQEEQKKNDQQKDQKPQDQKDQQKQDEQKKKDEQQKQDEKNKSENKDEQGKKDEKKKEDQKKSEQEKETEKPSDEKKDTPPSVSEKLQQMKISEEKAKMLLEAMKNQEVQYLQQNKRKATKPKDKGKPDW
jgi:tetratricopeptide (TPR) repeat protein